MVKFSIIFAVCTGARIGAPEGTEASRGERQAAAGVCAARQRLPPVAAGDQVGF